jgi:hypothetical protein
MNIEGTRGESSIHERWPAELARDAEDFLEKIRPR